MTPASIRDCRPQDCGCEEGETRRHGDKEIRVEPLISLSPPLASLSFSPTLL